MIGVLVTLTVLALMLSGCGGDEGGASAGPDVLVTTTYLRDITERVAGDRLTVQALFPEGSDPHGFEPTPRDAALIADTRMVIVDVFGLQPVVDELIQATAKDREATVEAAAGLPGRSGTEATVAADGHDTGQEAQGDIDPHFWLDPVNVIGYVENIRDALTTLDPAGEAEYAANAARTAPKCGIWTPGSGRRWSRSLRSGVSW